MARPEPPPLDAHAETAGAPSPPPPMGAPATPPAAPAGLGSGYFAAVDLGSNSFHMVIARVDDHDVRVVDRLRDPVQLAMGLDEGGALSTESQARALASLSRFGQRLREFPAAQVRTVGTNTLRQARKTRDFLERGAAALGHPIEVIAGQEEARLIYLGVAHTTPADDRRRLVIDIGGGSTECIIGEGFEPLQRASLYMGCVGWTRRFFPKGEITREGMRRAQIAAGQELLTIERRFRSLGWEACFGASGTVVTIDEILRALGWSQAGITRVGLRRVRKRLVATGRTERIELAEVKPDRALVLPGGVAILSAVFRELGVERMTASTGALREGLLYDMLGRVWHEDVRNRTIRQLAERYHVDSQQAARVERVALQLWKQSARDWKLADPEARNLLVWAARLHEVGLDIAYSGHHKHGAYVVAHSEMPGFALDNQQVLATLIRAHRRKFSRALFAALPPLWQTRAMRLAVLLRVAVLLQRSRPSRPLPPIALTVGKSNVTLELPRGWLAHQPLVHADLAQEVETLRGAGFDVTLRASRRVPQTETPSRGAQERPAEGRDG